MQPPSHMMHSFSQLLGTPFCDARLERSFFSGRARLPGRGRGKKKGDKEGLATRIWRIKAVKRKHIIIALFFLKLVLPPVLM